MYYVLFILQRGDKKTFFRRSVLVKQFDFFVLFVNFLKRQKRYAIVVYICLPNIILKLKNGNFKLRRPPQMQTAFSCHIYKKKWNQTKKT